MTASPQVVRDDSKDVYTDSKSQQTDVSRDVDTDERESISREDVPENITGFKLWAVMTSVTLVFFLMLLDTSILSTATPEITKDFHSLESIGWYGAAYVLACATFQPLAGKIYSNFDLKWTFFGFFLLFEFGSLLCAISVSSGMFIVSRAIAGLGASGLQNGSLNILAASAPMARRPMLMGVMLGVGQLGLVAGPLVGGLFTQFVSWRWCFYINLPLGLLVAILLVFVSIPQPFAKPPPLVVLKDIHHKLDLVGFTLFAPCAIMLLLAVQWGGNEYAWDSAVIIGLLAGAGAMTIVWLVWNGYQGDDGMLPFRILSNRYVWASCLYAAFMSGAMFVTAYYLPVYFQGVRGDSPAISGVYLLPGIISQLFAAVLSGKLMSLLGYYMPWAIGSAALTAVGYGLLSTLSPYTIAGKWIGYQILCGVGRGCGMQIPMVATQNALDPTEVPMAMALLTFIQTLSASIFLSAGATILINSYASNLDTQVPGLDIQAVLDAGANGLRDVVHQAVLPGVLKVYAQSIDNLFYMCAALAVACLLTTPWLGWVDIRGNKATEEV